MIITFLQRPSEVGLRRKTILLNGRQCGYLQMDDCRVDFTVHLPDHEARQILAEVERQEGVTIGRHLMPGPTPPEWLEDSVQDSPPDVPHIIIP